MSIVIIGARINSSFYVIEIDLLFLKYAILLEKQ